MRRQGQRCVAAAAAAGLIGLAPAPPAGLAAEGGAALSGGYRVYHAHCYRCHGVDAVAGVLAPDLRRAVEALDEAAFARVVLEGAPKKGMPAFGRVLDAAGTRDLYAYLLARAGGTLAPGRPDGT